MRRSRKGHAPEWSGRDLALGADPKIGRQIGVFQEPRGLGSEPPLLAADRYLIH
jgi:hypothetical protein